MPRWRWPCWRRAGRCHRTPLDAYAVFGELSLGGELRDSPGALAVAEGARRAGLRRLIVPRERAREAALVEGLEVAGVSSLRAAADVVRGARLPPLPDGRTRRAGRALRRPSPTWPTSGVRPRRCWRSRSPRPAATTCCSRAPPAPARRCSPGGSRRSCPAMTRAEAIEVTRIHSVAGLHGVRAGERASVPRAAPHDLARRPGRRGRAAAPGRGDARPSRRAVPGRAGRVPALEPRRAAPAARGRLRDDRARAARAGVPDPVHAGRGDQPVPVRVRRRGRTAAGAARPTCAATSAG